MEQLEKLPTKSWNNVQAFAMAAICLLLGIAVGYLVYPSKAGVTTTLANQAVATSPTTARPTPEQMKQVTPEQMKHMADKKAEPLLAQLQKNPNDLPLLIEISKTYFSGRQFQTSIEYLERANKIRPNAEILTSIGSVYHYAGDDAKAIESVNRALQVDPKFDGALFNLGMLKWQSQGDAKGAISAWEKLLKTHPKHPQRAEVERMIAQAKKHTAVPTAANAGKPLHQ